MADLKERLKSITDGNPFAHLGDAVYETLYRSIIRLEIPAEASLSETALAKVLDVSRTPVRDALLRLQEEGLLVRGKGASFIAAPLKKEECRHLMEVRLAIEGQAAFWAAERISPEQENRLKTLQAQYEVACAAWDTDAMVENDHAFHQLIVDAAGNPYLSDLYRQISPRVLHYRYFLFRRMDREDVGQTLEGSVRHHRSVMHAVRLGFGGLAREQLERDISGMMDIAGTW